MNSSTPRGLDWTGDAEYCAPWTFVGAPAVMLPAGFGKNGLPLGIQIVGRSNWPAWRIAKALGISAHHGWAKFDTVRAYYSLAGRDLELRLFQDGRSEGRSAGVVAPVVSHNLVRGSQRDRQVATGF